MACCSAAARLRRRPGGSSPVDPGRAAPLGGAVLAAVPALLVAPRWTPVAIVLGAAWPALSDRRARRAAADRLARALPETTDLLVLGVGAGLNIPLALHAVARHGDGPVAGVIGEALHEVRRGRRLADALHELPARHGEVLRPLTAALESSERYGTPLLATLERLAAEVRLARRRRAEEVARRLPVKLLFPLVTCTLPAFGLLTVAPLLASGLRSLRLEP
jgi:tight adherence protein C